ncbi:MAG: ribonuclease III family protein [Candidatus Bathyarchaeota archaeon]|nr:ribonuclease III family protein [Candidatus Bathyarchaeota archaeon]MDI6805596.1 ribonuclease III family protein [Candidatus Bathyarchaeia archaeon]
MKNCERIFPFIKTYGSLREVLTDHDLASLGDAYINFVYSLALSNRRGKASGAKVKGQALAEALRKAGLRKYLPSRMTSHVLADAAEALIVYGWLRNCIRLEESVATLEKSDALVDALTQLLSAVKERIKFS